MLPYLRNMLNEVREVKHQVKNDHSTNLRVEQDDLHAELVERIEGVQQGQRLLFDSFDHRFQVIEERLGRTLTRDESSS